MSGCGEAIRLGLGPADEREAAVIEAGDRLLGPRLQALAHLDLAAVRPEAATVFAHPPERS